MVSFLNNKNLVNPVLIESEKFWIDKLLDKPNFTGFEQHYSTLLVYDFTVALKQIHFEGVFKYKISLLYT